MAEKVCPLAKKCGGCDYQGISYEEQLKKKENSVRKLMKEFGEIRPIIGADDPYHYRNKVHAVFSRKRNGEIVSGIYQEGTHKVVPVDACQIENEKADEIIVSVRKLLKSFKVKVYDEDTGYGLLRHVLVRTGYMTGQIMVVLVVSSPIFPSKNNFVKALRAQHPEISTVVLNVNDRKTSMVLGPRNITLEGKGYIEDRLCGCMFRISPTSFYQINPVQTEKLYKTAMMLARLNKRNVVVDAYCGIGTIGMVAAKTVKEVIGVELNAEAVRDAFCTGRRRRISGRHGRQRRGCGCGVHGPTPKRQQPGIFKIPAGDSPEEDCLYLLRTGNPGQRFKNVEERL